MEMRLPQVERIVTETIDGKRVQKQIYADGSYGIRNGDEIERHFQDGKIQTYQLKDNSFILASEKLPNGIERWWYDNGQLKSEEEPGGTKIEYDPHGKLIYHATGGVVDTLTFLCTKDIVIKTHKYIKAFQKKKEIQAQIAKNKERLKNKPKLEGKSGVVIADEIAKRQISGEKKRVVTPEVGKELRQEIMKEMNNKKGQRE